MFSGATILYQNDCLTKGYNHAEFQKTFLTVPTLVKVIPSILQKVHIEAIDINQSLQIFWSFDCWDGIIIVYNYVLGDYRTPLEKLVAKIDSSTTVADTLLCT